MNFRRQEPRSRIDPSGLRLPLIALIDVILFLLMYFMFAGSLDAEEAELGTAIRAEQRAGRGLPEAETRVIEVVMSAGNRPEFRIGARRAQSRAELTAILKEFPSGANAVVKVSNAVPVAAAAAAVQACKDAGFANVSYLPTK